MQYAASGRRTSHAILLEYVPEVRATGLDDDRAVEVQPSELGVMIHVGMKHGKKRDFTVNMLHTVLHQKQHLPAVDPSLERRSSVSLKAGERR